MAPSARAPKNLRDFLDLLRARGDLAIVEAPVDPRLEVAEIHRRVIAAGGPALLFTHVGESSVPVATNLFGTRTRAELAFGRRPFELIERAAQLPEELMPPSFGKLWGVRSLGKELLKVGTKKQAKGPVEEVVTTDVDLGTLPVLTTWPEDGGPFFTLPLVYTEDPDSPGTGHSNLGIYRMQVHGPKTTGMHWQIGKGGGFHYAAAEARGEALPVTVFFGGPPALLLSAVAPLPEKVPELLLASLIAGDKLATCEGSEPGVNPHPLIAEAELALGGKVPPRVRRSEGPFGDHYGYYSLAHDFPVFEVDWMARRHDAILPATVVGKPRQEDFYLGDLLQELLAPLFPLVMPGVEQLWSYGETGYHSLAAAVVKERYRLEAMSSAFRILGEGQLSLTKFLLVTDQAVNLKDFPATLAHVLERTEPEHDLFVFADVAMDTLDYTGPKLNSGSKGVLLGLGEPKRALPKELRAAELPQGLCSPRVFCPGCLVVGGPSREEEPGAAERFAQHPTLAGWPLVVLTDEPEHAAASPINFLWTTFTRFEPAADVVAARRELVRNHVAFHPPVVIDARVKPGFPGELFCDRETAGKVTMRWSEYFPEGGIEMGDSDRASLDGSLDG